MWFKHRAWIPIAWMLLVVNLGGAFLAARTGEPRHAALHLVLAAGCAWGALYLRSRRSRPRDEDLQLALDDNERLQQVVETMQPRMEELEQRLDFAERLLASQREQQPQDPPPARPPQR